MLREKLLGDSHFDTVISLNTLAVLYKKQGKYKDAGPLYERALAIAEQLWGGQDATTQIIRKNYALFLEQQDPRDVQRAKLK
jgi:tetratricopeptide (TPR) repeat protein